MRANNSGWLPKLPLQGGQCIFVYNATITKLRNCGFALPVTSVFKYVNLEVGWWSSLNFSISSWSLALRLEMKSLTVFRTRIPVETELYSLSSVLLRLK